MGNTFIEITFANKEASSQTLGCQLRKTRSRWERARGPGEGVLPKCSSTLLPLKQGVRKGKKKTQFRWHSALVLLRFF